MAYVKNEAPEYETGREIPVTFDDEKAGKGSKFEPRTVDVELNLDDPITSKGTASIFSGVFNLCNTILGAGVLGISYSLSLASFYPGLMLLILFCFGANIGLKMLVEVARWTKAPYTNYFVLAQHTYPWARYLIDGAVVFKCFGVAASYLIVIGDNMSSSIGHWLGDPEDSWADRRIWIAFFMILCVPMSLAKKLDHLRHVSLLAIFTVVYLMAVVVYFYATNPDLDQSADGPKGEFEGFAFDTRNFIESLPLLVFAYTCHQNVFSVYSEMKNNTVKRVGIAINFSTIFCTCIYLVVGIFGYLTYASKVESNILNSFPADNEIVNSCRLLVAFLAAFSYPLQIHPCRISLDNIVWGHKKVTYLDPAEDKSVNIRYWVESVILIGSTFALSMAVDDLGVVFGVIGSTGSTTLCYLLPGLFFLRMESLKGSGWGFKRCLAVVFVIFGIFMLVAGNYVSISKYI
eukprot:Nk52_evm9s179 gene=Nk52_evmTU9s179